MSENIYFKEPIPKGMRIFVKQFEVMMAKEYINQIEKIANSKTPEIVLESEPKNKYDTNAIKVLAKKKVLFWEITLMLGYLPRDLAKFITEYNLIKNLIPRAKSIWFGDEGGFSFTIDLLGNKDDYESYKTLVDSYKA